MNKQAIVIASAVGLVLAFLIGAMAYKGDKAEETAAKAFENADVMIRADSHTVGPDNAKVVIVEFLDPGCETCAKFYAPVKEIMAANAEKIKLVIRYAPFHQGSDTMVKMLMAASSQDKYWQVLEMMFATQGAWASHHHPEPEKVWEFLPATGADVDRLRADMARPEADAFVKQEIADCETLGVKKTPTFFVNGKPLPAFGLQQLVDLVDSEIALNYPE
ncbi:MAG: protein-disulfide isomerase [Myxococcota bacterium]|jgi:protein-disulfide isomerase